MRLSGKLLIAALALALLSCQSLLTTSCSPAPVGGQDAAGQDLAPQRAAPGSVAVIFTPPTETEYRALVDLTQLQASLAAAGQQPGLGYLFNRVYDDGANDLIATDSYVPLEAALAAAAQQAGLELSDIWYPGCSLQFKVLSGDGESYAEVDFDYYQDFSFERLSAQTRYFYGQAQNPEGLAGEPVDLAIERLYEGDATAVPTVLALSTATEEQGIPAGVMADVYLEALLAGVPATNLRSDLLTPRLLWGLSPQTPYDVTEYRFPTNITSIRIVPPAPSGPPTS